MKQTQLIDLGLKHVDELFSTQEERDEEKREKITEIPLQELHPFKNHPFRVEWNEEMNTLAQSVFERGVITPCLARPREAGGYELISGHRRKAACEQLEMETIPVIIREMDDDTATITMVDSNQQRENLLPSEKAFAYQMKLEAMKHQGKTSGQLVQKWSRESLTDDESGRTVQRYIRLTKLIPTLLKMVDNGRIALTPAVELSYLSEKMQEVLLDTCEMEDCTPSYSQAVRLRKMAQESSLTAAEIREIMQQPKANQRDKLVFRADTFAAYFPRGYTAQQMEQTILHLLQERQARANTERGER